MDPCLSLKQFGIRIEKEFWIDSVVSYLKTITIHCRSFRSDCSSNQLFGSSPSTCLSSFYGCRFTGQQLLRPSAFAVPLGSSPPVHAPLVVSAGRLLAAHPQQPLVLRLPRFLMPQTLVPERSRWGHHNRHSCFFATGDLLLKRGFDSAIEYMHDVKPPYVRSIRVDGYYCVSPLMKTLACFAHLNSIAATPVTSRSMVYEKNTHDWRSA